MTINQLDNFAAVVEAGSFSQAAEKLFLSPQALIQKIARIEQELGFKLLIRNSKGVHVSAAGEEFYKSAKKILAEYNRGIECAAQKAQKSSTLRIGLPESVAPSYLLTVCRTFTERYPEITLSYDTYSRADTVKALLSGKIDVGAQIRPEEEPSYFTEKLFPVGHYCLIARNNPLAQKPAIELSDLTGRTIGLWGPVHIYHTLGQKIHDLGLNIQLRSLQEDFSEALVFCMAGNILLGAVPVMSYLQNSLKVIPFTLDLGFYYYLSYTTQNNEVLNNFLQVAREIAQSEEHPWKQTLSSLHV